MRIINAAHAAREATAQLLAEDPSYIVIGEGCDDPAACFETTRNLHTDFPGRVFDSPISENGVTGVCVGAALNGLKPIHIHMRQDFLLYAADQIINSAAKWNYMFAGRAGNVPMVIKAFTGRGWGAGSQHAQDLESIFAHIPGLKVVCPSSARNAKGLLISAARDPNPVMILEHRWIHHLTSDVPEEMYETPIGKAEVYGDCTKNVVITWGAMVSEALRARSINDDISVVDLQTLRPLDKKAIYNACKDALNVCVVAGSWETGLASIVARLVDVNLYDRNCTILAAPDFYPSATPALIKDYYPTYLTILKHRCGPAAAEGHLPSEHHDIPDKSFTGPF